MSSRLNGKPSLKPKSLNTVSRGSVLLCVVVPLFALLTLTASIALLITRDWEGTRVILSESFLDEAVDSALWAMRYHYHHSAIQAHAGTPLDLSSVDNIILSTLSNIHYSGGAGATDWQNSTESGLPIPPQLRITPTEIVNPGAATVLTRTGTYLDGRTMAQGHLSFTLERRRQPGAPIKSDSYTLIFCQISAEALALSGLADFTSLSANIATLNLTGSAFIRGNLEGDKSFNLAANNALVATSFGANIKREGIGLLDYSAQEDFRYQTEIAQARSNLTAASNELRSVNAQRTPMLRAAIAPELMTREGLSTETGLSPQEASLRRDQQPFYTVPVSQRYFLAHQVAANTITPLPSQYGELGYASANIPTGAWISGPEIKNVGGINRVVLTVDPTLAPSPLFIASAQNGVYGDYSNFILQLKSGHSLTRDFSLITPNTVVVMGDLNTDNAHGLSLVADRLCFGYSHFSEVTFTGSLTSLLGASPSPWRNASGIEHGAAQLTLEERPSGTAPVTYYLTLLQRSD